MRKLVLATSISLLAIVLFALPAAAGRTWCARDPIVALNGVEVQIWVAIPDEYVGAVNGPVEVKVQAPAGVSQAVRFTDEGFNNHGEVVKFATLDDATVADDGSFPAQIQADIPVDRELLRDLGVTNGQIPFQITVITGSNETTVEGTNDGTKVQIQVAP